MNILDKNISSYGLSDRIGPLSVFFVMCGCIMQGYSNGTSDALFVGLCLLFIGVAIVMFLFSVRRAELRAFLLTYGMCLLVGGLAQVYSVAVFDNPQSTYDAVNYFFPSITSEPPYMAIGDKLTSVEYALPLVIWDQVYKISWYLGVEFGPYIGVMFNAFVMAITGCFTVSIARQVYGDDDWRLKRVGVLFSLCGLFILFGAILLRDCFTTFTNVLVLWGIVRWIVNPTPRSLIFAILLTAVSSVAMYFLRVEAIVLFGLFWLLSLSSWYFKRKLNAIRIATVFLTLCLLIIGSGVIMGYLELLFEIQDSGLKQYGEFSSSESAGNSLGMKLVVDQPLPIRLISGTGLMMLYPIPVWSYFNSDSTAYHWLMGYHAIYKLLIMPLVLGGLLLTYRLFKSDKTDGAPFIFLATYLLINLAAIVATSLEQRHFAQFMPAMIVLAALPDTRITKVRIELKSIAMLWFGCVILVHFAWATMKGF